MSYDSRCYDLACVFLEDDTLPAAVTTDAKKNELAQLIQTTIEDFIQYGDHVEADPKKSE